jgi:hypothetical protein
MTGPVDLFAAFAPEDWVAFRSGIDEIELRYAGLKRPAAEVLHWMEIEELAQELASRRLDSRGAELIELTVAS